ncbi:MAG: hypothetical protein EGP63_04010 [Bacteroides stercoris]|nr:hypothetical protein [Bacteroides stercoris]
MWQKTKKTRYNQFSAREWQVFVIQIVGAESCKKRVTTEYSVVTLIILSSLSVYPMNRGMQGFGDE